VETLCEVGEARRKRFRSVEPSSSEGTCLQTPWDCFYLYFYRWLPSLRASWDSREGKKTPSSKHQKPWKITSWVFLRRVCAALKWKPGKVEAASGCLAARQRTSLPTPGAAGRRRGRSAKSRARDRRRRAGHRRVHGRVGVLGRAEGPRWKSLFTQRGVTSPWVEAERAGVIPLVCYLK